MIPKLDGLEKVITFLIWWTIGTGAIAAIAAIVGIVLIVLWCIGHVTIT